MITHSEIHFRFEKKFRTRMLSGCIPREKIVIIRTARYPGRAAEEIWNFFRSQVLVKFLPIMIHDKNAPVVDQKGNEGCLVFNSRGDRSFCSVNLEKQVITFNQEIEFT